MGKRSIQFILPILGLLHFSGYGASSQRDQEVSIPVKFEIRNDPNIVFGRLDNGFQYALMKNNYPEERIVTALDFEIGSVFEEENERGLAHFLEHMAFRGSKHFPNGEIVERMQKLGIAFGHNLNAYTSFFNTCYELNLPNGKAETVNAAFFAFRDFCDGLSIQENDVNQERGVILAEKRDRDNVSMRLTEKSFEFYLDGTILPHRFPIGKTEVIEGASSGNIRQFYEKWYSPEKMFFVAVGNMDIPTFEERIRNSFQDLKPKASPHFELNPLAIQRKKFFYFSDSDLSKTSVGISLLFSDQFANDSCEARRHRIILNIALGILRERLLDKRSENPLLFADIYTDYAQDFLKTKHSIFNAAMTCEHKNWATCLSLLEQEMRKMYQYGISEAELQRQKESFINAAERDVLAAKTRHSSGLVAKLVHCHSENLYILSPEDYCELIKRLNGEITAEDCRNELAKIWQNIYISVASNQAIGGGERAIEAVFDESERVPVVSNENEVLGKFAYEHFDTPYRAIVQRDHIEDLGISQLTLANGVKINLKPTNFKQNQIEFVLTVGHGQMTNYPHPQPGIFFVAGQAFSQSGLKKNPWKELHKFVSSKCVRVTFGIDSRSFIFCGTCDKKNLPFGLQLMVAHLFDPGFEERALFEAREAIKPTYEDRAKSPSSVIEDQYSKFITGNDSIAGLPDEGSVFSVQMDDLKNLLLPVFQKEAMELTIVGDFDLETTIQIIQDTLGALPSRSPSSNDTFQAGIVTFPRKTAEKSFFFTGDENRTVSILTFLTDDENNVPDNRALTVLAEVISDRLRNKIRKMDGKVYSPIVDNNSTPFKNFGLFEIVLSLHPDSTYDTKNEILAIIEDLKRNPIPPEELERSILPIRNSIRDKFKQNGFWLDRIKHANRRPQCLDNLRTMRSFYENVTPQILQVTAQKYFNNPIYTIVSPMGLRGPITRKELQTP
ncbi:MAG: insulinase family protein [Puniceicoccales bacterium]|jgi:zinc protease|nr:insulinase family protein [Puniceicoccales bacterium]